MGVNFRFQMRWIINSAIICVFSCSVLLLIMPLFLSRKLGHDYYKAYYNLKDLDASVLLLISTPVFIYILLSTLLVVFFKLLISHKIAGPLFRFERCAASIGRCHLEFSTKLRPGDQLNRLARTFDELRAFLDRPLKSAGARIRKIENLFERLEGGSAAGDKETIHRCLGELEEELAGLARDLRPEDREAANA